MLTNRYVSKSIAKISVSDRYAYIFMGESESNNYESKQTRHRKNIWLIC